ncbi:MAG: glycosyltransferase family 39 protein [Nitrospirae bacterium]|nr:glycosyltransferase family 39 protein [Nitrospirota bacterium]
MKTPNNLSPFRRSAGPIILLLIFSFAVKAFLLANRWVMLRPDTMQYMNIAKHIFGGEINEALSLSAKSYLPFYPVLIAGAHVLIKDWTAAAQLVSFFSGWLAIVPFYLLTRNIFDEKIAIISSLFFIVSPDLNFISTGIGSDASFLLLSLLALWLLWMSYEKGNMLHGGLSVFLGSLAVLTRIAGIVFFPLYVFWTIYFNRNNVKRLLVIGVTILLLIVFAIPLWPTDNADNQNAFWKVTLVSNIFKDLSFLKLDDTAGELRKYEQMTPGGRYFDFFEIARHYMHVIYLIGLTDALMRACGYAIFPLIVAGLFRRKEKINSYGRSYLLSVFLAYAVMNYIFLLKVNYIEPRYLIPGAVALFPWAGIGYIRAETYLKEKFLIKSTVTAIIAGALIICATGIKFYSMRNSSLSNKNIVEAGKWTQYGIPSRSIIVTNVPAVPFSADKPYIDVECADIEQCMKEALGKGADFLIYKSGERNSAVNPHAPVKVFNGSSDDIFIFMIGK